MATTPAITTTNPNRELRKDEWKEMALQQKAHIGLLMERVEMYTEMYTETKKERDNALAKVLTDDALERLQKEAFTAGRDNGYEDAIAEFEPYKKQRELDALREELAELKGNNFDCDVYWAAENGDIVLYKIPNNIAGLNTEDGDNAVLETFQNGYFGEEWGSYSSLSVVEMTREMIEEHVGELQSESEEEPESESDEDEEPPCDFCGEKVTERDCPCLEKVTDEAYEAHLEQMKVEEPETPKSTKDLVIDQLNEEPHQPERRILGLLVVDRVEPLHEDATHQVVRGYFNVEYTWKVPAGINLRDTDTFEFGDKWGTLYISNKITGEEFQIDDHDENDDFKRAHDLEVEDRDDDDNAC